MAPDQVRNLAQELMPYERDRERIDEITDCDCSWGLSGVGRFRVNILRQRGAYQPYATEAHCESG